mmetsp:Transcript_2904/g.6213  ORF Transcript_2904/g.6213 Transcript_2904/m.6213 type:complete len:173 (-) Transcript_2904:241-759(-)
MRSDTTSWHTANIPLHQIRSRETALLERLSLQTFLPCSSPAQSVLFVPFPARLPCLHMLPGLPCDGLALRRLGMARRKVTPTSSGFLRSLLFSSLPPEMTSHDVAVSTVELVAVGLDGGAAGATFLIEVLPALRVKKNAAPPSSRAPAEMPTASPTMSPVLSSPPPPPPTLT